ncbi:integrase [Buttiauxella brennerae]|uniref:integrase n=1 Tax=Buttiauxella brennerae TaxID=82988 RepID=UPI00286F3B6D|nr:site-specific integrase [Buttiauxella brennerae]
MAFYNIEKRLNSDGTPRFRCVVAIKEKGKYTHRESKTFSRASIAKAWGARRVLELEAGMGQPKEQKAIAVSLCELIEKYLNHQSTKAGRSLRANLGLAQRAELGSCDALMVTARDFIDFGRARIAQGRAPATVANNMASLSAVLNNANTLFGIPANISAFNDARQYMQRNGIIGDSSKRNRRPTTEEIDQILAELKIKEARAYSGAPFSDIFMFSILTCMRVGEVCRIRWSDVDDATKSVLVRDRKDPRKKVGNHMVVPLMGGAWEILKAQPEKSELIFPYRSQNISLAFFRVKKELGIEDLRYHDLRREGASRLFEMGFSVEEVAQVTGHKNLQTLWTVYREIYPQTLHDRFEELQNRNKKDA